MTHTLSAPPPAAAVVGIVAAGLLVGIGIGAGAVAGIAVVLAGGIVAGAPIGTGALAGVAGVAVAGVCAKLLAQISKLPASVNVVTSDFIICILSKWNG